MKLLDLLGDNYTFICGNSKTMAMARWTDRHGLWTLVLEKYHDVPMERLLVELVPYDTGVRIFSQKAYGIDSLAELFDAKAIVLHELLHLQEGCIRERQKRDH